MSKMYESIEELVQKTLNRSKATPSAPRLERRSASTLNDELEELEKTFVDRIGRLKGSVKQSEALAADEVERSEKLIESLRSNVALLEAKVKETEQILATKDAATQSLEKNLTEKIARLETQLRDTEKIVHEKEKTIQTQEQKLNAKVKDLESQLRANEKILAGRHAQIGDLQAQLKTLTHGIQEMSSFFKNAEALAVVEAQGVPESEQTNGGVEKPAASQFAASDQVAVPREFFADLTRELTEVLGPIASMVIRDHVASFGESMESFPKARVPDLLRIISEEIFDEDRKIRFRERLTVNP